MTLKIRWIYSALFGWNLGPRWSASRGVRRAIFGALCACVWNALLFKILKFYILQFSRFLFFIWFESSEWSCLRPIRPRIQFKMLIWPISNAIILKSLGSTVSKTVSIGHQISLGKSNLVNSPVTIVQFLDNSDLDERLSTFIIHRLKNDGSVRCKILSAFWW